MNTYVRDNLSETCPATVTAAGDITYADAANSMGSRLAKGTAGEVLAMNNGLTGPEWFDPQHQRNQSTGHTFTASASWETDTSRTITDPGRAVGIMAFGHARFDYNGTSNIEMRHRVRISTDGGSTFDTPWYAAGLTDDPAVSDDYSLNAMNYLEATPTGDIVIEGQVWVASADTDFTLDVTEFISWLVPA